MIRRAWVAYAATLSFAVVAGEVSNLHRSPEISTVVVANWIVTATLLCATWAYALAKPLGTARYWRSVFWTVLFANLVMLVPVVLAGGFALVAALVLLAAVVPAYVAAYLYAYRSAALWEGRGSAG